MKLLLDQCLPRSAAALLRAVDIDAVHTGEINLATAEDFEILQRAQAEKRVIVTLDADFHTLLALSSAISPSVIRVRIEGLEAEPLARLLETLIKEWAEELDSGAMLTVSPNRVRYHHLPIF